MFGVHASYQNTECLLPLVSHLSLSRLQSPSPVSQNSEYLSALLFHFVLPLKPSPFSIPNSPDFFSTVYTIFPLFVFSPFLTAPYYIIVLCFKSFFPCPFSLHLAFLLYFHSFSVSSFSSPTPFNLYSFFLPNFLLTSGLVFSLLSTFLHFVSKSLSFS